MSTLTALARAQAASTAAAQPIATLRHVHISDRPLVFVPLMLAGEANAPLAAMVGDRSAAPTLLVVPQPRNRDLRFTFAGELADLVIRYIDGFRGVTEAVQANRGRETRYRYVQAPQVLVPNPPGVRFVRLLGRSTRLRRSYGRYAVDPSVPLLGQWLTFLGERAEHPGSSMLLAMTEALGMHWATGQSAVEDGNLAALMGWIDPPAGLSATVAAAAAEDPLTWPPAGPATDPTFDNEVLAPAIAAYDRAAGDDGAQRRALAALETALAGQLRPTWDLMWRAVEQLRRLPEGSRVASRWAADRDAFTSYATYLQEGGLPQPRRDSAVAAAIRLDRLERAQAAYDAQRALDDPLVMAEYRMVGEAFAGTVVAAVPDRVDSSGPKRKLRPHITVLTRDPVRLEPGTSVVAPPRVQQRAQIVSLSPVESGTEVVLELSGGMGRALTPAPGSVPALGEDLCYSALTESYQPPGRFPLREETPWTHGGPPQEYVPSDDDAVEEWS